MPLITCSLSSPYTDERAAKAAFYVDRTTRVRDNWAESLRLLDDARPELLRAKVTRDVNAISKSCVTAVKAPATRIQKPMHCAGRPRRRLACGWDTPHRTGH